MTEKKNVQFELDRLADALIEDILNASDEEIISEAKDDFENVAHVISETRAVYEKAIGSIAKKKLIDAKRAVREDQARERKVIQLNPEKARRCLERILKKDPETQKKLTMAARKGEDLSDEDVLNILQDLEELGIYPLYEDEDSKE